MALIWIKDNFLVGEKGRVIMREEKGTGWLYSKHTEWNSQGINGPPSPRQGYSIEQWLSLNLLYRRGLPQMQRSTWLPLARSLGGAGIKVIHHYVWLKIITAVVAVIIIIIFILVFRRVSLCWTQGIRLLYPMVLKATTTWPKLILRENNNCTVDK